MNLKSWFVWFCLAVIAVSEVMLFRASQQKTEALDKLSAAQHEADQARKDLDDFKASAAAAAQNADTRQLRVENAKLSQAVTVLKNKTNQLQQANVKLAQQLAAVGRTVQQQETQLQQWQTVSQQAQAAVQQSKSRATAEREACIANLKLIDAAKLQWALVNNKTENDIPTAQDLLPYFKDGAFPVCPAGGTYTINSVGQAPTCSIPGHALPLQ
ncbi:MAG TPA: hypothetical protein VFY06_04880 [Verrucomicrobiae bacterium]|nr:hypothetical protein [Verrucomicrobiae bacterium]